MTQDSAAFIWVEPRSTKSGNAAAADATGETMLGICGNFDLKFCFSECNQLAEQKLTITRANSVVFQTALGEGAVVTFYWAWDMMIRYPRGHENSDRWS